MLNNALLQPVLKGTARQSAVELQVTSEVQTLLKQLNDLDQEDRLLLAAGATAIYSQAGYLAPVLASHTAAAPSSIRVVQSPRLVAILQQVLLSQRKELFIEFLQGLHTHGVYFPYEILPEALDIMDPVIRKCLLPVLGERGHWLSQWNPRWHWVNQGIDSINQQDQHSLRRAWIEGTLQQRTLALTIIRKADPSEGRSWLKEVWSEEKAEVRAELLKHLQNGLCVDDEPWLDHLLDDRSEQVRLVAAALLKQLPDSAFVRRMEQRSEKMLAMNNAGQFDIHPPLELAKEWIRDGYSNKPTPGRGKRSFWIETTLCSVPISYWCIRLQRSPDQLIRALGQNEYADDVIAGWTRALLQCKEENADRLAWTHSLWNYWLLRWQQEKNKNADHLNFLVKLLQMLPGPTAEHNLVPFLVMGRLSVDVVTQFISALPRPWSNTFSMNYLKSTRDILQNELLDQAYEWSKTMDTAMYAIPDSAWMEALAPWKLERSGQYSWTAQAIKQQVEQFVEVIRLRKVYRDELKAEVQQSMINDTDIPIP